MCHRQADEMARMVVCAQKHTYVFKIMQHHKAVFTAADQSQKLQSGVITKPHM